MTFTFEQKNGRFVVKDEQGNEAGEVTWSSAGDIMIIDHTFVEEKYRGNHLAEELVRHAVDLARQTNRKVLPLCPFAKAEFERKAEYADVLRK